MQLRNTLPVNPLHSLSFLPLISPFPTRIFFDRMHRMHRIRCCRAVRYALDSHYFSSCSAAAGRCASAWSLAATIAFRRWE